MVWQVAISNHTDAAAMDFISDHDGGVRVDSGSGCPNATDARPVPWVLGNRKKPAKSVGLSETTADKIPMAARKSAGCHGFAAPNLNVAENQLAFPADNGWLTIVINDGSDWCIL